MTFNRSNQTRHQPEAQARTENVPRRSSLAIPAIALLIAISSTAAHSQENAGVDDDVSASTTTPFQKDLTDAAVDKAVNYLVSQQRSSGAITDKAHETTMTSLAIMAMGGVGVQPSDSDARGHAMRGALAFVLQDDRQDDKGYFGRRDGSRMYGHGITTLMLAEMLGMGVDAEQDRQIHDRCQRAIDLILSSQNVKKSIQYRGGWRYNPEDRDADLSVTIWQLMALRSAKNDGLQVPSAAIRDAVEYLKRSYASTIDSNGMPDKRASGFCYTPTGRSPTYTMTSAGLLAMQVCGEYESPLVAGAAAWLLEHPPKWKEHFFFYGTYYYAQGMYQRGGDYAETAQRLVQEILLDKQQNDGSWQAESGQENGVGKVYSTSLAVLSLSVKYHYLPIYQR